MSSGDVDKKRKRGNNKASWRNADSSAFDDMIAKKRKEDHAGGNVTEMDDDALFSIDTAGVSTAPSSNRARARAGRPIKIDQILAPNPNIKTHVPQGPISKTAIADMVIVERMVKAVKTAAPPPAPAPRNLDLWGAETVDKTKVLGPHSGGIRPPRRAHEPALHLPSSGQSYNPSKEAHQAFILEAAEAAKKELFKNAGGNTPLSSAEADAIRKASIYDDSVMKGIMRSLGHLSDSDGEEEEEEEEAKATEAQTSGAQSSDEDQDQDDSDLDEDALKAAASKQQATALDLRRTRRDKNRLKAHRDMLRRHAMKKLDKRLNNVKDFERVKQHTFQKIKQSLELIPLRDQYKLEKDRNTVKRLSLANYRAPVPDVKLSDELPSSLRVLAPEGHLLADRMDSLFRREMLEPRVQKTARAIRRIQEYGGTGRLPAYRTREKKSFKAFTPSSGMDPALEPKKKGKK
ncbi:hypothetical protein H696_01413 [Fonticula alba]|uniref:Ribosome biogenesis protein NOP53 n=1 Tax=Fonticula alba TaxID=691883 RepID=A0A058ZDI2_FONAL|nr:hypothetical protein H696_01413 [Fonticula alba]KCV72006.1 hypothetical protein H696_01413 [Fonticula alba]|eukprot:XP_009493584.1 hypothetical protein H696_01413 [Fonticula alba]